VAPIKAPVGESYSPSPCGPVVPKLDPVTPILSYFFLMSEDNSFLKVSDTQLLASIPDANALATLPPSAYPEIPSEILSFKNSLVD